MKIIIFISIFLAVSLCNHVDTNDPKLKETYKIQQLKAGDGVSFPSKGAKIAMHYTGFFPDTKKVFDSSVQRGTPFELEAGVGQVIPCWDELVTNMSVGEKISVVCPSAKAYGSRGAGSDIPPNTDIAFEMELLKIE